jgi:hypothetical protein
VGAFDDRPSVDLERDTAPEQQAWQPDAAPSDALFESDPPRPTGGEDEAPTVAGVAAYGAGPSRSAATPSVSSPWGRMEMPKFRDEDSPRTWDEDEAVPFGPAKMAPVDPLERTARADESKAGPPHRAETQVSEGRSSLSTGMLVGLGMMVGLGGFSLVVALGNLSNGSAAGGDSDPAAPPRAFGEVDSAPVPASPPSEPSSDREPPPTRDEPPPKGRSGYVLLRVEPWAQVFIDGVDVGLTPVPRQALPAGEHRVELRNPDLGLRWTGTVRVEAGLEQTLRIDLEAVGQPR